MKKLETIGTAIDLQFTIFTIFIYFRTILQNKIHNKLTKHNYERSHLTINHMYFDGSRIGSKDQKKGLIKDPFQKKELQKMYINVNDTV